MRRINYRIGAVIVAYSVLLTAVFIAGVLLFQGYAVKTQKSIAIDSGNAAYVLDEKDLSQAYSTGTTSIQTGRITNISDINNYYAAKILRSIPVMTVIFCLILIVSSFSLWRILRHIQNSEAVQIAEKLKTLEEEQDIIKVNNAIALAYNSIKGKFAENLNEYKRLNSYLSHEQKNAIAILRANMESNNNTKYLQDIDNISNSIDDILTLSDSADNSQKAEVDAAIVCASVCDEYSKLSDKITFDFNVEDNALVLAKERWIYRAISNLVDNAIKYGNNKPIEVTVKNKNHSVIISVRDHGIGIDKAHLDKIFNHNYRVNNLNKDGYGIGLSLVSYVCDLCGGFVWVDSEHNEGSTFYLSFPEYKLDS